MNPWVLAPILVGALVYLAGVWLQRTGRVSLTSPWAGVAIFVLGLLAFAFALYVYIQKH